MAHRDISCGTLFPTRAVARPRSCYSSLLCRTIPHMRADKPDGVSGSSPVGRCSPHARKRQRGSSGLMERCACGETPTLHIFPARSYGGTQEETSSTSETGSSCIGSSGGAGIGALGCNGGKSAEGRIDSWIVRETTHGDVSTQDRRKSSKVKSSLCGASSANDAIASRNCISPCLASDRFSMDCVSVCISRDSPNMSP